MNLRSFGVASAAALVSIAMVAPGAGAQERVVEERFGGAASGRALDIVAAGQRLAFGAGTASGEVDPVVADVVASAAGIGTPLAEETMVAAGARGEAHDGCVAPDLTGLFTTLHLEAGVVCGRASIEGTGNDLVAVGSGVIAQLVLDADSVVQGIVDQLRSDPTLGTLVDTAFGELQPIVDGTLDTAVETAEETAEETVDETVDPVVHDAVGLLNDTLSEATGGLVTLPDLDASDTLGGLLDRLANLRLATVDLGEATGRVTSDDARLVSAATDDGADIRFLPGFWADGSELLRIRVAHTAAEVVYDRSTTVSEGTTSAAQVTVESPLFDEPIVVSEGQAVRVLCSDPGEPTEAIAEATDDLLCTEISVGTPHEHMADGRLHVEAATVTVRLAQGAKDLTVPAQNLPVLGEVGPSTVLDALNGAFATLGIDEGVVTAAGGPSAGGSSNGGATLTLGGATAQGGGAKVLGSIEHSDPGRHLGEGTLPRTGGLDQLPAAATALLGAGAGLRAMMRRRLGV